DGIDLSYGKSVQKCRRPVRTRPVIRPDLQRQRNGGGVVDEIGVRLLYIDVEGVDLSLIINVDEMAYPRSRAGRTVVDVQCAHRIGSRNTLADPLLGSLEAVVPCLLQQSIRRPLDRGGGDRTGRVRLASHQEREGQ